MTDRIDLQRKSRMNFADNYALNKAITLMLRGCIYMLPSKSNKEINIMPHVVLRTVTQEYKQIKDNRTTN